MKFCKKCKMDHSDEKAFCDKCGMRLYPKDSLNRNLIKVDEIFRNSRHNSIAIKKDKIFFLSIYYQPSKYGDNQYLNEYSAKILNFKYYWSKNWLQSHFMLSDDKLKKLKEDIQRYFLTILNDVIYFNENFTVCVVPSHEEGRQPSGIRSLAESLSLNGFIDGTQVIYRVKSIPKKTDGGPRDYNVEINSLSIKHKKLIKNKRILLLDDVTTSGTSLKACKELLLNNGAKLVVPLALGETYNKFDMFGIKLWKPSLY